MSVKTAGVGHFAIPTAPAAGTSCTSGAANVFTTTYVQLIASTAAAIYITGIFVEAAAALGGTYDVVQLATGGAGSETIVGQYLISLSTGSTTATGYRSIYPPIPVATSTRIACKTADSVGAKATLITLECINQSNVVNDGVVYPGNTTQWNGTNVSAPATAGIPDINVKNMNNVAATPITTIKAVQGLTTADTIATYTGNTVQTGDAFARIGANGAGLSNITLANDFSAAMKTSLNAATPVASLSGDFTSTMKTSLNAATPVASLSGDLTSTMKTSVTTAATAATPTAAAVTGNVGGSVGSVVGLTASNLDATVSSRLASASYTAPDNAGIATAETSAAAAAVIGSAIKAQTDLLVFSVAGELDVNALSINGVRLIGDGTTTPMHG